jgi:hypothetical protein
MSQSPVPKEPSRTGDTLQFLGLKRCRLHLLVGCTCHENT